MLPANPQIARAADRLSRYLGRLIKVFVLVACLGQEAIEIGVVEAEQRKV